MNKIKLLSVTFLLLGLSLIGSRDVHAACQLVDPIQGTISVTCKDARLTVSGDGVRYLPHPNTVKMGTYVTITWALPFTGNTQVTSWNTEEQRTHFWQKVNGVWTYNPDNAIMQENGVAPRSTIRVMTMPNGERGWAVMYLRDLLVWNGGN